VSSISRRENVNDQAKLYIMTFSIDREHLRRLRAIEDERFLANYKKSGLAFLESKKVMHEGVPMSWMTKWPGEIKLL
jgi:polyisoprenoid-binding protein YceI